MTTYIHYPRDEFDLNRIAPIKNRPGFNKPIGGLWASAIDAEWGWRDWCENEGYNFGIEDKAVKFKLKDGARVLEIHRISDLGLIPYQGMDELSVQTGIPVFEMIPDFEALAREYDALDVRAGSNTELYWKLYGWDCDTLLVLNSNSIIME